MSRLFGVRTLRKTLLCRIRDRNALPVSIITSTEGAEDCSGGGGNLGVILVRVCEPVFQNLPHSYTWPSKKRTHSYT